MAERRKNRKKKEQPEGPEDNGKPTKDEYSVAKYMRQKLPQKKTSLLGHKVEYFIASKAIDCLLDSPWAIKSKSEEALFTTRESVVRFMDKMLQHKFFHRAKKIIVSKDPKKKKKENDEGPAEVSKEKEKDSKKSKVKADGEEKSKESEKTEEKKEADGSEKKKEKKKIKLDMHMKQLFIDGNEVYVWIYDPIPMRTWINGMLMVVAAVLVCLFPLWPQVIRHYIYYLSVAAALFLVVVIGLAIARLVVFVLIWAFTLGKHHFWLLPNLTEDVGFLESFWPLYHYEYKGTKTKDGGKDSSNKEETESTKEEEEEEKEEEKQEKSDSSSDQGQKGDQVNSESEHDSGGEDDKAKTDNGDNGFEILDAEEEMKES